MPVDTDPNALVVTIDADLSLSLNSQKGLGDVDGSQKLTDELRSVFERREANGSVDAFGRTPKAVFVRAPRTLGYGSVAKTIDAVKMAGAEPIALQIDYLD
jgi:biopolymer transport protein ExbD